MKKIYAVLTLVTMVSFLQAQLTQANHAPANGDSYQMLDVSTTGITPGASGANVVWNFGTATVNATSKGYTATTASDPKFPSANVKVTASNGDTYFYGSSAADLKYYGGQLSAPPLLATMTFTSPAIFAVYPVQFNVPQVSPISGSIAVTQPAPANGFFEGSSEAVADGTGTLIVPGNMGTFTATTRYKTLVISNFTVSTFIGPMSGTLTQLTYDYYSAGIKAPVFSIMTATANIPDLGPPTPQMTVGRNKDAVGINPTTITSIGNRTANELSVNVYPNPASSSLFIRTGDRSSVSVEIFDLTGRLVVRKPLVDGAAFVDVADYKEGLYIYTINGGHNDMVVSGKITVSH